MAMEVLLPHTGKGVGGPLRRRRKKEGKKEGRKEGKGVSERDAEAGSATELSCGDGGGGGRSSRIQQQGRHKFVVKVPPFFRAAASTD